MYNQNEAILVHYKEGVSFGVKKTLTLRKNSINDKENSAYC